MECVGIAGFAAGVLDPPHRKGNHQIGRDWNGVLGDVVDHQRMTGSRQHSLIKDLQAFGLNRLEVVRRHHHHRPDGKVVEEGELIKGVRQVGLGNRRDDLQVVVCGRQRLEHGALLTCSDRGTLAIRTERNDAGYTIISQPPHMRAVGAVIDGITIIVQERGDIGNVNALQKGSWLFGSHDHLPRSGICSRKPSSSRRFGNPS
jgi:hypothetical protein